MDVMRDKNNLPEITEEMIKEELETNEELTKKERRKLKSQLFGIKIKNFFNHKPNDLRKY